MAIRLQGTADGPEYPLWSFREDVYLELAEETLAVCSQYDDVILPRPSAAVLDAMNRMCLGPVTLANAISREADRFELQTVLSQVEHLVVRSFGLRAEQPLISVVPLTEGATFDLRAPRPDLPIKLSRFALIHADGRDFLLESPLSLHRVILHGNDAMAIVGPLSRPVVPSALVAGRPYMETAITHLMAAGMIIQALGHEPLRSPVFAEDTDPALVTWPPIDLMFHSRSTLGRHDLDFGASHLREERSSAEPVVKTAMGGPAIPLYRPRWEDLAREDAQLTSALERTRSTRRLRKESPSARELSELLYRAARVRSLTGDSSERPYLASGDCYELELYVTVADCPGIPRGVYHYDPLGHRLEPVSADPCHVSELLENGRVGAGLPDAPMLLITFTARFPRLSWKYNGLSYALVLKNVGLLTQTLSLVCTAIGLASCPMDIGDADLTGRVLGTDWRTESGVGGLVVGRANEEEAGPPGARQAVNDADWPVRALR